MSVFFLIRPVNLRVYLNQCPVGAKSQFCWKDLFILRYSFSWLKLTIDGYEECIKYFTHALLSCKFAYDDKKQIFVNLINVDWVTGLKFLPLPKRVEPIYESYPYFCKGCTLLVESWGSRVDTECFINRSYCLRAQIAWTKLLNTGKCTRRSQSTEYYCQSLPCWVMLVQLNCRERAD